MKALDMQLDRDDHRAAPFGGLVGVGAAGGREGVHLVEEEDAGRGRLGAREQLPHRPLALPDPLVEELGALRTGAFQCHNSCYLIYL